MHLTLDLAGQARFGPDVEWLADADPDHVDYTVDAEPCAGLLPPTIRRYWPGLGADALLPAYTGDAD